MELSRQEYLDTFALNVERERQKLGYSQEEMARKLNLSLSAYKRIVNRENQKVDIYLCYLGYKMTNRFLFEMVGYDDKYVHVFRKIHSLNDKQLKVISDLIDTFLEE